MPLKTIILAGGKGTRLAEETSVRPKPLVEIGGQPILWHVMQIYARHGVGEFLIACGYKGEMIKEYFANMALHSGDVSIDLASGRVETSATAKLDWKVHCVDTGLDVMTGGRLKRLRGWLGDDPFFVTYGDGVGNVDIGALLAFHRAHGKAATVTAVHPPARFGSLSLDGTRVSNFAEKEPGRSDWINGGFFVFEPSILDLIDGDDTKLEGAPLATLADRGELHAFKHTGFWQPMDTIREKLDLESLWASGEAPWLT